MKSKYSSNPASVQQNRCLPFNQIPSSDWRLINQIPSAKPNTHSTQLWSMPLTSHLADLWLSIFSHPLSLSSSSELAFTSKAQPSPAQPVDSRFGGNSNIDNDIGSSNIGFRMGFSVGLSWFELGLVWFSFSMGWWWLGVVGLVVASSFFIKSYGDRRWYNYGKSEVRVRGSREKKRVRWRREKKISKILNAKAIVIVYICTVIVTLVHLCTILH